MVGDVYNEILALAAGGVVRQVTLTPDLYAEFDQVAARCQGWPLSKGEGWFVAGVPVVEGMVTCFETVRR